MSYEDPTQLFDAKHLSLRIFARTPLTPLTVSAFAFKQPFRELIVVQGLGALVTLPWIRSLAAACTSDTSITEAVDQLGCSTEPFVFLGISGPGVGVKHHFLWWQVGTFYHILYGFVLPLSVLYMSEVWSRICFTRRWNPTIPQKQFSQIMWDSVGCVVLVAAVFLQMVWAVLVELQA